MNNKVNQADIFLESEGDQWYQRNAAVLTRDEIFPDVEIILSHYTEDSSPARVLEVGCVNASKLSTICERTGAQGYGVDPSAAAVADGMKADPSLSLTVGIASQLDFADETFDLIFIGFCLYLVDRKDIYKVVAEADRVLKPSGRLAIMDFDPPVRHKRKYHHKEGIYSYKSQYGDFFTAAGHYHTIAKKSFSHSSEYFSADANERVALTLLHKEEDPYPEL